MKNIEAYSLFGIDSEKEIDIELLAERYEQLIHKIEEQYESNQTKLEEEKTKLEQAYNEIRKDLIKFDPYTLLNIDRRGLIINTEIEMKYKECIKRAEKKYKDKPEVLKKVIEQIEEAYKQIRTRDDRNRTNDEFRKKLKVIGDRGQQTSDLEVYRQKAFISQVQYRSQLREKNKPHVFVIKLDDGRTFSIQEIGELLYKDACFTNGVSKYEIKILQDDEKSNEKIEVYSELLPLRELENPRNKRLQDFFVNEFLSKENLEKSKKYGGFAGRLKIGKDKKLHISYDDTTAMAACMMYKDKTKRGARHIF